MGALLPMVSVIGMVFADFADLSIGVEVEPQPIHVGDIAYVRVTIFNQGPESVSLPTGVGREYGTMRIEVLGDNDYVYRPFPRGTASTLGGSRDLDPGTSAVVHDPFFLPSLNQVHEAYWTGRSYSLTVCVKVTQYLELRAPPRDCQIEVRSSKHLQALKRLHNYVPADTKVHPTERDKLRPGLWSVGLGEFPAESSDPKSLEDAERDLLADTAIWRAVCVTRLLQDLYVAESPEDALIADKIEGLFRTMGPIEQQRLGTQLVNYAISIPLPQYLMLAERLVPLLPESPLTCSGNYREMKAKELKRFREMPR